ncbi:hypothetical protein AB0L13_04165 [Saccharopolyspora shandongensis]|uniref:hypothetical protein n=1 Tax=Saccharopolyspora shandongensis TaxID=418495 RepID=UPI003430C3B8
MSEPLSLELKELLTELRLRGWTLIRWGPENAPQLMASMFQHPQDCADVFILCIQEPARGCFLPEKLARPVLIRPLSPSAS